MRRSALLILFSVAGVWIASGAATPGSGLYGVVKRGPITPVCQVGVPCDEPARGVTLIFRRTGGGVFVGRVTTGREGRFRIALPAGTYAVRQRRQPAIGYAIRPAVIRVRRLHWERVEFSIDTGIR